MSDLLYGHDGWLDDPFQRDMDARVAEDDDSELDGLEEDMAQDDGGDY